MLQRVMTYFSVKFFGLTERKFSFRNEERFCAAFQNFLVAKKFMDKKGGVSQFSVSVFVSQYGTIRRGTRNPSVLCFRNFLVAKIFRDNKRAGASQFSVETFLSHSTEAIRRGNILCCVSGNIWWRKSLWIRTGGGEYHIFTSKIFFSQFRQISYRNT